MPMIFGRKNRLVYDMTTKRDNLGAGFHTDTLVLRDALREYERHWNVTITPHVPRPGELSDPANRLFAYRNNDEDYDILCALIIRRGDDIDFEAGQDLDFVLMPGDIVDFSPVAC